jgi:chromosome segregation ATPase
MPTTQTLEKQQSEFGFMPDQHVQTLPDISDLQATTQETQLNELVMPQISGLEALKEGTFTVDLEKTISNMLLVIKNMEAQLERVLSINASLEKENDTSKDMILKLKHEKSQLQTKIEQLEIQMPAKRELQIQIEHISEEKNQLIHQNQNLLATNDFMQKKNEKLNEMINSFEEEKIDARMEIDYMEVQIQSHQTKLKKYEDKINALRGEKIALTEKLKSLQDELKQAYSDQFKAYQDVKQTRQQQESNHNG